MRHEETETLIVGGGQAGLAMSEHLGAAGCAHLVLERHRIAERWRTERWDSLVANGPAWHDRFPGFEFTDTKPDDFATKESVVTYFEAHAAHIDAPIRCGVEVTRLSPGPDGMGFRAETARGTIDARNVVAATGPFQRPNIPSVVPDRPGLKQLHSTAYRNPDQLPAGAVLVVGAGSSGAQIADELLRAGRRVFLSVGPHDRPPRRYRGKDFVWWLGALGKWAMETPDPATEHVTIAVSGAHGGETVDFRRFANRGMTLLGRTLGYRDGVLHLADDLQRNLAAGDANYLSVLDEADAHIAANGLDFPKDPTARDIPPDPDCVENPLLSVNLGDEGITTVIWATGFVMDFGWLQVEGVLDKTGRPVHRRGISPVSGLYFLGLPWLSCRGSAFIWGVWQDARHLADHIAAR